MPSYHLHTEYCKKAGITNEALIENVNEMIDAPYRNKKYDKFRDDCGKPLTFADNKFYHDLARNERYPEDAELDIQFLSSQTEDFCVAYFLHHFLDLYNDKTKRFKRKKLYEKRRLVRDEMKYFFSYKRLGRSVLTGKVKDYYNQAKEFFFSYESQKWLQNNIDIAQDSRNKAKKEVKIMDPELYSTLFPENP